MLWWPEDSTWHSLIWIHKQNQHSNVRQEDLFGEPFFIVQLTMFLLALLAIRTSQGVAVASDICNGRVGMHLGKTNLDCGLKRSTKGQLRLTSHQCMEHCTAPLRGWLPTHMGHKLMSSRVLKLVQYWINDTSAEQIQMLYKGLKFFVVGGWRINLS